MPQRLISYAVRRVCGASNIQNGCEKYSEKCTHSSSPAKRFVLVIKCKRFTDLARTKKKILPRSFLSPINCHLLP